jgi:hypothetical protein
MERQEALKRIEACLGEVMRLVNSPPVRGAGQLCTALAPPDGALAALDEALDVFARSADKNDPGELMASAAMRIFFGCMYLASPERARTLYTLAKALGDGEGNKLREAYACFFRMHYAIRTGDVEEAAAAYLDIQRVERIPDGFMGPEAAKRTAVAIYDSRWTPDRNRGGKLEFLIPSPPLLVKAYAMTGRPPGDRFPLQFVTGIEGFKSILAKSEINKLRLLALDGEANKAQVTFESAVSRARFSRDPFFMVPAICATASAWARAGDAKRAEEIFAFLPPEPWPVRPIYNELKRLCIQEAYRQAGRLDTALEFYRSWPREGLRELHAMPWAVGTARLAGSLCKEGSLAEAERLAAGLVNLGGDLSVEATKAQTYLDIMDAFASRGHFNKAEKLCRKIEDMGIGFHPSIAWSLFRGELEKLKLEAHSTLSAHLVAKGRPPRIRTRPVPGRLHPTLPPSTIPVLAAADFALAAANGRGPAYGAEYADTLVAAVMAEAEAAVQAAAFDALQVAALDAEEWAAHAEGLPPGSLPSSDSPPHAETPPDAAAPGEARDTGVSGLLPVMPGGTAADDKTSFPVPDIRHVLSTDTSHPADILPVITGGSVIPDDAVMPGNAPTPVDAFMPGNAPMPGDPCIPSNAAKPGHPEPAKEGTPSGAAHIASGDTGELPSAPAGDAKATNGPPPGGGTTTAAFPAGYDKATTGPPAGDDKATNGTPAGDGTATAALPAGDGAVTAGPLAGDDTQGPGRPQTIGGVPDTTMAPVPAAGGEIVFPTCADYTLLLGSLLWPPEADGRAAAILSRRVESLLRRGNSKAAARALTAFENLPQTGNAASAHFNMASRLIAVFGLEGDLRSAWALYRALAMSEGAVLSPWLLYRPALALMDASLSAGAAGPSAEVFCRLRLEDAPQESLLELGEAARRTLRSLLLTENFDRAEALRLTMERLGNSPCAFAERARASLDLVLAYERAGMPERSMSAYLKMEPSPEDPEAERARGQALKSLLSAAARSGSHDRAMALKGTVGSFGAPMDAHCLRVRALQEMISLMSSARTGETGDISGNPGPPLPASVAPSTSPSGPPSTAGFGPHSVSGVSSPSSYGPASLPGYSSLSPHAQPATGRERPSWFGTPQGPASTTPPAKPSENGFRPPSPFGPGTIHGSASPSQPAQPPETALRPPSPSGPGTAHGSASPSQPAQPPETALRPPSPSVRGTAHGSASPSPTAQPAGIGIRPPSPSGSGTAHGSASPSPTAQPAGSCIRPPSPIPCQDAARLMKQLSAGNLHMAEAFYSIANLDDILPVNAETWASVLERLQGLYLVRDRPDGAEKVFAAMGEACTGALKPMLEARLRAGARIVRFYAERARPEDAFRVYGEMGRAGVTPGTASARARAAAVLVPRLAASGRLETAVSALLALRSLPMVSEVREAFSVTGSALIARLETLPERAAELCRGMDVAVTPPELLGYAAARVMVFYAARGKRGHSVNFFLDFMARHRLESFPPDALRPIAWALATLAESCRSAGMTSQAQAVYRHLLHPAFRGVAPELRACLELSGVGCPGAGAPGLPPAATVPRSAGRREAPAPAPNRPDGRGEAPDPATNRPDTRGEASAPATNRPDARGEAPAPATNRPDARGEAPAPDRNRPEGRGTAHAPDLTRSHGWGKAPAPDHTRSHGWGKAPAPDHTRTENVPATPAEILGSMVTPVWGADGLSKSLLDALKIPRAGTKKDSRRRGMVNWASKTRGRGSPKSRGNKTGKKAEKAAGTAEDAGISKVSGEAVDSVIASVAGGAEDSRNAKVHKDLGDATVTSRAGDAEDSWIAKVHEYLGDATVASSGGDAEATRVSRIAEDLCDATVASIDGDVEAVRVSGVVSDLGDATVSSIDGEITATGVSGVIRDADDVGNSKVTDNVNNSTSRLKTNGKRGSKASSAVIPDAREAKTEASSDVKNVRKSDSAKKTRASGAKKQPKRRGTPDDDSSGSSGDPKQ